MLTAQTLTRWTISSDPKYTLMFRVFCFFFFWDRAFLCSPGWLPNIQPRLSSISPSYCPSLLNAETIGIRYHLLGSRRHKNQGRTGDVVSSSWVDAQCWEQRKEKGGEGGREEKEKEGIRREERREKKGEEGRRGGGRKEEKTKDLGKARTLSSLGHSNKSRLLHSICSSRPLTTLLGDTGKPAGMAIRGSSLKTPSAGLVMNHNSLAPKTTPWTLGHSMSSLGIPG